MYHFAVRTNTYIIFYRTFRSMVQEDVFTMYTCTIERDEENNKPVVNAWQGYVTTTKKFFLFLLIGLFFYSVLYTR